MELNCFSVIATRNIAIWSFANSPHACDQRLKSLDNRTMPIRISKRFPLGKEIYFEILALIIYF